MLGRGTQTRIVVPVEERRHSPRSFMHVEARTSQGCDVFQVSLLRAKPRETLRTDRASFNQKRAESFVVDPQISQTLTQSVHDVGCCAVTQRATDRWMSLLRAPVWHSSNQRLETARSGCKRCSAVWQSTSNNTHAGTHARGKKRCNMRSRTCEMTP